jgi:hypothetical protein
LTWNRRSRGKYHRLDDGQAVAQKTATYRNNDREQWIVSAEPAHEPLVSQELFDRCQAQMQSNRGGSKIATYLFSGLVTCSHCGRTLSGIMVKGRKSYRCRMYDASGQAVCGYNRVAEDWLLDRVLRVLEEEMLAPERLQALRDEIRRQDDAERAPASVDPLRKRLVDLEAHIAQGRRNLAILPEDQVPHVVAVVRGMEEERDKIKAELARREGGGNLEGLNDAIATCEALLWRLREAVKESDPLLLREVVCEAIARIELAWERKPYGKRTGYVISGGVIHLRPQAGATPSSCPVGCTGRRAAIQPAVPHQHRRS